jgi:hypothetical protein
MATMSFDSVVQRLALQLRQTLGLHLAPPKLPAAEGAGSLIRRKERGYLIAYAVLLYKAVRQAGGQAD